MFIQASQYRTGLFKVKLLQDVCDICRVKVGQFRRTDAQLSLWDSTARASSSACQRWPQLARRANCYHLNWFNIIPGNDALREVDRQYTTQQLERREYAQAS